MRAQLLLQKAERLLVNRLEQLEARLLAGDEGAWPAYLEALKVLASLVPNLRPDAGGPMLTTAEMASRLGVAPKTLLRRKARGEIWPAVAQGKFLRWSGQENLR